MNPRLHIISPYEGIFPLLEFRKTNTTINLYNFWWLKPYQNDTIQIDSFRQVSNRLLSPTSLQKVFYNIHRETVL